ncbi:IclR family transcriptional regulator [Poseidonocella sp. HB161398]|uniref:IclR family transcriptional regulator n=1 Tax=Poseidonocella sp. HB161398 TaxID=2320855 RepID=UPI001108D2DC|nr:IclR family transcriptional regulator [Poseidonocella sp. HB161398]
MTQTDDDRRRGATIQSIAVGARFLEALAAADGPQALGQLARRTGSGSSTAHRYLQSLVREGLARQDPASGLYDLGPSALALGIAALKRIDPVDIASAEMRRLAEESAASAGVAIWTERGPVLVRWHRSAIFSISSLGLGDILPLDNTACGLVFQAHLAPALIAVARASQPAAFRGSPPAPETLAAIRRSRRAELTSHLLSGVTGQAAPVFDAQGGLACVITTVADLNRMQGPGEREAIFAAADRIAAQSGTAVFSR